MAPFGNGAQPVAGTAQEKETHNPILDSAKGILVQVSAIRPVRWAIDEVGTPVFNRVDMGVKKTYASVEPLVSGAIHSGETFVYKNYTALVSTANGTVDTLLPADSKPETEKDDEEATGIFKVIGKASTRVRDRAARGFAAMIAMPKNFALALDNKTGATAHVKDASSYIQTTASSINAAMNTGAKKLMTATQSAASAVDAGVRGGAHSAAAAAHGTILAVDAGVKTTVAHLREAVVNVDEKLGTSKMVHLTANFVVESANSVAKKITPEFVKKWVAPKAAIAGA